MWGMGRPLSEDLRKRIVAKREEGYSSSDLSQMFGVSVRSIDRYCERVRKHGTVSADKQGAPVGSKLEVHRERICGWIEKESGLTLEELTTRLAEEQDVQVHHTTVMRALTNWGYRYKKKLSTQESKTGLTFRRNARSGETCKRFGTLVILSSLTNAGSIQR